MKDLTTGAPKQGRIGGPLGGPLDYDAAYPQPTPAPDAGNRPLGRDAPSLPADAPASPAKGFGGIFPATFEFDEPFAQQPKGP